MEVVLATQCTNTVILCADTGQRQNICGWVAVCPIPKKAAKGHNKIPCSQCPASITYTGFSEYITRDEAIARWLSFSVAPIPGVANTGVFTIALAEEVSNTVMLGSYDYQGKEYTMCGWVVVCPCCDVGYSIPCDACPANKSILGVYTLDSAVKWWKKQKIRKLQ